jgi:acyl dehydratase
VTQDFFTPQTVDQAIGRTYTSGWILVDQRRIGIFGANTEDPDPHHVDPVFAAAHSPWGKTISFGFLTLSLMTPMLYQVYRYPLDGDPKDGYPASYGFKDLRFVAPVVVDSRIRGHFTVQEVRERKPGQKLITLSCSVEIEGEARPALTATWESLWLTPQSPA